MANATSPPESTRPRRSTWTSATLAGGFALMMLLPCAAAAETSPFPGAYPGVGEPPPAPAQPRLAAFRNEPASPDARRIANWALHSGDSGGLPYMIVDKVQARVFVFDRHGQLQGAAPALLGMERGDGTATGLGNRQLSAIAPRERTTPAGRFVASLAPDINGQEILWIDYDSALALHRVAKGKPVERRAERLLSATPDDNRISYGCINVTVPFYESVVSPAFTHSNGVVYILPETQTAHEFFGSYEVEETVNGGQR